MSENSKKNQDTKNNIPAKITTVPVPAVIFSGNHVPDIDDLKPKQPSIPPTPPMPDPSKTTK